MKGSRKGRTSERGSNEAAGKMRRRQKQPCVFCAAGYRLPAFRSKTGLYKWPGKYFGQTELPACRFHMKLYTDWLPREPEERARVRQEMNAIADAYFRERRSG